MTVTSKSKSIEAAEPHWLEWLVGVVSALLIIAMTGWIAGEAVLHQETAPEFRAEILAMQVVRVGFRVEFEIFNEGTSTAAGVKVRGELISGGQATETAETTFDYVPGRSSSRGGLFFSQNPAGGDIRIHALGYTEP
jgi:uncharacterized protein (TIGR02588 family)